MTGGWLVGGDDGGGGLTMANTWPALEPNWKQQGIYIEKDWLNHCHNWSFIHFDNDDDDGVWYDDNDDL